MTFDFIPRHHDLIDLSSAAIHQAITIQARIDDPQFRWQSYLVILALEGFCAWIEAQTVPIQVQRSQARLVLPFGFDYPGAITQLYLNQFRVCLIVAAAGSAAEIEIPASVLENSGEVAHFYVALAVHEEAQQAEILGFQRYDELIDQALTHDRSYTFARSQFDSNLDHLLLFASGLQPSAIPLPTTTSSWSIVQLMIQASHNTRQWIQQQLEQATPAIAQLADEILLANVQRPAYGLRSQTLQVTTAGETIKEILNELRRQGYSIPNQVRATYQNLVTDAQTLRLSFIIWELPEQEWSFLCILESLDRTIPAGGIRLSIQADHTIISQTVLLNHPYVITQAIGSMEEEFTVALHLHTGSITLPPFTCRESSL
jgi:hypothetical protein